MKTVSQSSPSLTIPDNHGRSWLTHSEARKAAINAVPGNFQIGRLGFHDHHEPDALAQTFDQLVAMLVNLTTSRDQLDREVAERRLTEAALKQNLEDLSRSNRQLEEFAYVASHDLQEPLRKIQVFCQMLEKDMGTSLPATAHKDLAFITDGASRMQQMVTDLLAFSCLGRGAVNFVPISLERVVDQALANLAVSIVEKQAHIERDALPEITGDFSLLVALYQNLIGNALKYNENRPVIRLTAAKEDGRWVFGVQDNGIGINPAYAEQIFAPFKRLHGKGRYPGTGLGLAICRKVIEVHEGAIWIDSRERQGAHFRFNLAGHGTKMTAP